MPDEDESDAMEVGDSPSDIASSKSQQPHSASAQDVSQNQEAAAEPDWSALCLSPPSDATKTTNEELQAMAREHFVQKLSEDTNGSGASREVKSPSGMLSALVVSLEPALGGSSDDDDDSRQQQSANKRRGAIKPKVRALHILCGAIEGCSSSDESGGLEPAIVSLLGKFLTSYCLPYEQDYTIIDPDDDDDDVAMGGVDDNGDDVGEAVRDAAIIAVAALASAKCQPSSASQEASADKADAACQLILQRIHLTQKAVECRCLSEDMTDYEHQYIDHGYGDAGADRNDAALEGLGTLPRARRSLCFSALDGAVAGCEAVISTADMAKCSMVQKLKRESNAFVSFVAACLHGETDPRCLRQMLHLLHRCQVVFLPLFALGNGDVVEEDSKDAEDDGETFPTVSLFDAVAPYYPIKFTPPPNDPYGITRDGLRDALMAIMCVVEEKKQPMQKEGGGDGDGTTSENMTSLSAKLFMERLVPPKSLDPYADDYDDDGGETTMDKIEAIQDLRDIFLPSLGSATSIHPLSTVDSGLVKELSSVLVKIHSDAIMDISAAPNANEKENYKTLLEKCRDLVADIAEQLESLGSGTVSSLWDAFVLDTVRDMTLVLTRGSRDGRPPPMFLPWQHAVEFERCERALMDVYLPSLVLSVIAEGMKKRLPRRHSPLAHCFRRAAKLSPRHQRMALPSIPILCNSTRPMSFVLLSLCAKMAEKKA